MFKENASCYIHDPSSPFCNNNLQNGKYALSDDTLPDGYKVKKGHIMSYVPYSMGRMEYLWGADALEFRPERWLDQNGLFQSESPFKFTAFQVSKLSMNIY